MACQDLPRLVAWHAEHQHDCVPVSRGSLLQGLDSAAAGKHKLEIGICGRVRDDEAEFLQVQLVSIKHLSASLKSQVRRAAKDFPIPFAKL